MDIRNRVADVIKLNCHVCQDFLKMIITEDWQYNFYNRTKKEIENNGKYKEKFIVAYEKMRDFGTENYSVDDMDMTLVSSIVHGCKDLAPTNLKTRICIEKLIEDRNTLHHVNENEDDEELYLISLLNLCNLKKFIECVDKFEIQIDDIVRLEYRKKYSKKIKDLKCIIDNERIDLIYKNNIINRDIQSVLDCKSEDERNKKWCDIYKIYMDRYMKVEKNYNEFNKFMIRASDFGIKEAHSSAADYFFYKRNYVEGERRLYLIYSSYEVIPKHIVESILYNINKYLCDGNELTKGMDNLITFIIQQGNVVLKNEDGKYFLKKNK